MLPEWGKSLEAHLTHPLSQFLINRGETAEHSTHAAQLVLPTIVAGLIKTISQTQHTHTLIEWLQDPLFDTLDSTNTNTLTAWGKTRLPLLLGGNAADVVAELAQQSQISKTTAGTLLSFATPLVLSTLRPTSTPHRKPLLEQLSTPHAWLSQHLNKPLLTALGIGNLSALIHKISSLARVA